MTGGSALKKRGSAAIFQVQKVQKVQQLFGIYSITRARARRKLPPMSKFPADFFASS